MSENGTETDREKIAAVTIEPEPQTVKDLRSFLGFQTTLCVLSNTTQRKPNL